MVISVFGHILDKADRRLNEMDAELRDMGGWLNDLGKEAEMEDRGGPALRSRGRARLRLVAAGRYTNPAAEDGS